MNLHDIVRSKVDYLGLKGEFQVINTAPPGGGVLIQALASTMSVTILDERVLELVCKGEDA